MTTKETAKRFAVSPSAVAGWCRDGIIPATRVLSTRGPVWEIKEADLEGFVPPRAGQPRKGDRLKDLQVEKNRLEDLLAQAHEALVDRTSGYDALIEEIRTALGWD